MARQPKKVVARPTGRPVNVQATLDHTSLIIREQDVPLSAPNLVLSEEDFGRLAAGYVCLNCLEDLDTAFPDACPVCGYGMREHQTRELNQHFEGYIALGPSTTLEEEAEMMAYLRRKEEHDTGKIWTPKPITVPRDI